MKENNENLQENDSTKFIHDNDNINKIELFDKTIKEINENILKEKNIFKNDDKELIDNLCNLFQQLFSDGKNLLEIKSKFGNNLSQYYLSSGQIFLSLEIIKIYYKIYNNDSNKEKNFVDWLINSNNNEQNIFEIGVEIQANPKDIIYFYNQILEITEKLNNNYIIYQILEKRKENIFILCVKEDKLFLLLFLYEKIKKYYPSSNPLDIKNKLGLAPLHFSAYYLSREITDMLLIMNCEPNIEDNKQNIPLHFAVRGGDLSIIKKLIFYGGNKEKSNNENLTPADYANKYGNSAMIHLFTNNPLTKTFSLNDKKYDKLFLILLFGCILIKYKIYNYFWKSYITDALCLFSFLYLIFKSKNYYIYSNNGANSNNISYESLFQQCDYDKNKIKKICPKCKIIKKYGTKHCIACDSCIEDFDHHCYWINKCINAKIMPEFFCFLILTLISLIINLVLFFKEFTKFKNEAETKNYYYYISLFVLVIYIFIFSFGIAIITSLLYERIIGKIFAKKKITLEENLLNKKNNEDDIEKNINNNSNNTK